MDLYILMLKGLLAEMDEPIQEMHKAKLEEFTILLQNANEDDGSQMALIAAMLLSMDKLGIFEE